MGEDFYGANLNFDDFERLLKNEDLNDEPAPIQRFVTDKKFLGLPPLSEIQLEIARHITQIFKPETLAQLMGEKEGIEYYNRYTVNEVICQLGKGSGKDHVSRVSLAYISYLLHCLRDPLEYFGKASGVYIDLVNLAVNAKQAQQVFFDPLKNLLLASPWANDVGFEPRVQEIFWFDRPVRMFSGHSEAEGWEGYEVLTVVLDEISAFKALPNSVLVLTPSGFVKNGDLKVGDFVIGGSGNPVEVVGVYPQGEREVFEITFDDGTKSLCSDDHIWNVYEYSDGRRKQRKNLRLKEFKSLRLNSGNAQFRYSVPLAGPINFTTSQELPIDPYVMGILLSEGSLRSPLGFTSADDEIVSLVRERCGYNVVPSYKGCKDFEWRINSGGVLEQHLRDFGLWGTTSKSKFIPDCYLRASIEDRKLLLAGLMDGDGTYARGQGSYTTVSDRLNYDFIELCRSLGGAPTTSKQKSWYKDDNGDKVQCLDRWMICPRIPFNPFLLRRKAEKWTGHRKTLSKSIVDVRSLGYEDEMTCIKVGSEDGLYVIEDYIVTHNTDVELKGQLRNKGSASEIYEMARASITSRFPSVGKVVLLSFPRFKGDFIQQRYNSVINDLTEHGGEVQDEKMGNKGGFREAQSWALKAATWEVNPTRTREEFENEFRRDPIMARARFACEPPEMEDAYFRDPDSVRSAFRYKENPLDDDGRYKEWFLGMDEHPRYIHVDLGLKRDRAAVCMVHSPGFKQIKTMGGVENLPIIEMDYIQSWKAENNSEIPFANIRSTITDLSKRFTVVSVTFDQWNCMPGDTMVFSDSGLTTIEELIKNFDSASLANSTSSDNVINVMDSGSAEVFSIKTKLGYSIEGTDNHKVLTREGWKYISDLNTDDYLRIKSPNFWPNSDVIDINQAIALGYMVSEGSFYDKKYNSLVRITSIDEDTLDICQKAMFHIADDWTYSRKVRWEATDRWNKAWEDSFYSKKGLSELKKLGWIGGSFDEEVPWSVLSSGKEVQRFFLKALFDGDGSISGGITRTGFSIQVSYESRSKKLCEQVRMMLLNFGIISSWYEDFHCGSMRYRITIGGGKCRKFVDEIGFISARKSVRARNLVNNLQEPSRSDRYELDETGCVWLRVKSIESCGVKNVYDISMNGDETFIANGVVVHNSADMIQSLRSAGINADLHTVAKKDYDTLSTAIYDGRLRGYWNEILVEDELLKLKLINNTKVDHPTTGSKDLADSVAGATFMCISNLSSDFEIDIEILDEVDYDVLTSYDEDLENRVLGHNRQQKKKEQEIPDDIKDWLQII